MNLVYTTGDVTLMDAQQRDHNVLVHCCNDVGGWGRGVVMAISGRWAAPEKEYRRWAARKDTTTTKPFALGQIQIIKVGSPLRNRIERNFYVCNMIGQRDIGRVHELPPVRYGAIHEGFIRLREWIKNDIAYADDDRLSFNYAIHMPRMGCGLAGGQWEPIEAILKQVFADLDITVVVYDYEGK